MINKIKQLFKKKEVLKPEKYTGLSDFFLNASTTEKKEVIREAAKRANEDQLKVFNKALKMKTN